MIIQIRNLAWTELVLLLHRTLARFTHGVAIELWAWLGMECLRPLPTSLTAAEWGLLHDSCFQGGSLGNYAASLCHMFLDKVGHKVNPDSRGDEIYSISRWGTDKVSVPKGIGMGGTAAAIFGNLSYHTVSTCLMWARDHDKSQFWATEMNLGLVCFLMYVCLLFTIH
jgi:hypothetical protein